MAEPPLDDRREYIRHAADVPIEVRSGDGSAAGVRQGVNVSFGGLAFAADAPLEPGASVGIRITAVEPVFEAEARVAWCAAEAGGYTIGVQFLDARDAFRSRMVEQVCAIRQFRQEREQEGRSPSGNDAASAWIERYADRFPRP